MYKINYTIESFEEVLKQAYDSLTPQDIEKLLRECIDNYLIVPQFKNDFIWSVYKSVKKKRNISFKEWKAISAYIADCKKVKNNKSF
jgi:hypothetical protein